MLKILKREPQIFDNVGEIFRTCREVKQYIDFDRIAKWFTDGLQFMVQYNYPFPTSALGSELPASPLVPACAEFEKYAEGPQNTWDLLEAAKRAIDIYYNAT